MSIYQKFNWIPLNDFFNRPYHLKSEVTAVKVQFLPLHQLVIKKVLQGPMDLQQANSLIKNPGDVTCWG